MSVRLLMIGLVACGGGTLSNPVEIVTIADRASLDDQRSDCGDPVLQDQVTSGGERVATWQPCFDTADEEAADQRGVVLAEARSEGVDVAPADTRLVEAERVACIGIPVKERQHSPFSHRKAIDQVEPLREGELLVGVRVTFKKVRGLTADWMRRDIECHRARWLAVDGDIAVMGMSSDPTLLEEAELEVTEQGGKIVVTVRTLTPEQAELALSRARGEQSTQRANR